MNESLRWMTAHNATVLDEKMNKYIDFTSGIFCANLGHNNPAVLDAVMGALHHIGPHCYTYGLSLRERYIERLLEWTGYEACHLFTTGSEAVEAAMRVACLTGFGPDDFFALPGTFHGKTWGPREIAIRTDFWDFYERDVVLVEGYRGWDAHFWTSDEIDSCKQAGLLIVDEIQSGFGRTGKKFAYEHYRESGIWRKFSSLSAEEQADCPRYGIIPNSQGMVNVTNKLSINPDILVIGKGQGNGYAVSAILCSGKAADTLKTHRSEFSSTHGGNPAACAAGLAVLDYFDREGVISQAEQKGRILHEWLEVLIPLEHRGRGMVAAVLTESVEQADAIVMRCRERGLLLVHTGKASVKIGPPLTIPEEQLVSGLKILGQVVREVT